ncbi:MAG: hypothetical protein U5L72_07945 [Bacteroidales bacterium]|nr:hypothetical protein [Bacteroidales bacterium]
MSYFRNIRENPLLKEAFWEVPASFAFVILYYLLITKFINMQDISSVIFSSLLFSVIWFLEVKLFSLKAKVSILPVFSFIESLAEDDFSSFIYRLPGQFLGAILAIPVMLFDTGADYVALYQFQFIPADSFLLGIFTGFIAQIIYFIYYILFYKTKLAGGLKLLLLSAGYGRYIFSGIPNRKYITA